MFVHQLLWQHKENKYFLLREFKAICHLTSGFFYARVSSVKWVLEQFIMQSGILLHLKWNVLKQQGRLKVLISPYWNWLKTRQKKSDKKLILPL